MKWAMYRIATDEAVTVVAREVRLPVPSVACVWEMAVAAVKQPPQQMDVDARAIAREGAMTYAKAMRIIARADEWVHRGDVTRL